MHVRILPDLWKCIQSLNWAWRFVQKKEAAIPKNMGDGGLTNCTQLKISFLFEATRMQPWLYYSEISYSLISWSSANGCVQSALQQKKKNSPARFDEFAFIMSILLLKMRVISPPGGAWRGLAELSRTHHPPTPRDPSPYAL
jgi:hypothetical protein